VISINDLREDLRNCQNYATALMADSKAGKIRLTDGTPIREELRDTQQRIARINAEIKARGEA
jgi:hypothetical protein